MMRTVFAGSSLIASSLLASAALAQSHPVYFDSPWIGYDTAVYPQGLHPWSSRVADFNGDGVPDLATVSFGGTAWLSVLLADGEGGYLAPETTPILLESLDLEVGDFDGDGDIDIVVCDTDRFFGGNSVSLYRNDGEGGMTFAGQWAAGTTGPSGISSADFNNDGWLDLAVAFDAYIVSNNKAAVLFNNAGSGFDSPVVVTLNSGTRQIDSGDINGDGDVDFVVAHESNRWTVVLNNGDGTFAAQSPVVGLVAGSIPELPTVHLSDIDNDGDLDVFFSNRDTGGVGAGAISLWRNNGSGNFGGGELLSFGIYSNGGVNIATADTTGDGWKEILVATEASGNWIYFVGDGAGGFEAPRRLRAGHSPMSMQTADLNADGDQDVIIVARDSNEACVYLNPGAGEFVQPAVIDMVDPQTVSPSFTTHLESGDLDNDDDLDLVIGVRCDFEDTYVLSVRLNNGDGTFAPPTLYPCQRYPVVVHLRDLNNDGFDDLLYMDGEFDFRFRFRINNGSGTFGPINSRHIVGGEVTTMVTEDVDNDGDADVLVDAGFFNIAIMKNQGGGTFAPPIYHEVENGGTDGFALGDFNADGNLDLLTPSGVQGYPQISFGNGDGTFGQGFTVPTGRDVRSFAVGHLDADTDLDFVSYYNLDETGLGVRRGRGDGNFFPATLHHGSFDWGDNTSSVQLGDVDGDGVLDAVNATFGAQDFSFWRGRGDGTFDDVVRYGVGQEAYDMELGDFNGDGLIDAAVTTQTAYGSWWYAGIVLVKGRDPNSAVMQKAQLTRATVQYGTRLSGSWRSLENDDANLLRVQSEMVPNGQKWAQVLVHAMSPELDPTRLDVSVLSRVSMPGVTARVWLRNWDTNRWVLLGSYSQPTTELLKEFANIANPGAFVRSDGLMQVRVRYSNVTDMFDSFMDLVQLEMR
jgi:hypothetical protein